MKPKLILIHGLYFHGSLMKYMEYQLTKSGYEVLCFSYKTVSRSMDDNTESLVRFVKSKVPEGTTTHFVGHSLGGILIRKAHVIAPEIFSGRSVTLGTPHQGSIIARVAQNIHERILGGAYEFALDGDLPPWSGPSQLGSIAGNITIGLGQVFNQLEKPNDGTVSVNETKLDNLSDHIELAVTHTSLVYSKKACQQVDYFLQHGKFNHKAVQ